MSIIVRGKSPANEAGLGDKIISPVLGKPCAAMWTNATEFIGINTAAFVVLFPVRGFVLRISPITSTSSLAGGGEGGGWR